jgi:hypothetical protein
MTGRQKLARALDRLVLGAMMASLAFVLEKALDRLTTPKAGERRPSRLGGALIRRLVPGFSASLRHERPAPPLRPD